MNTSLTRFSLYCANQIKHLSKSKYRKAFTQSAAKDDPSAALIQAEILERHMDKLSPIYPEDSEIRALKQLVENRRKLVQNRVDLTNLITATLKNYYPHVLDWFKEKDTAIFCNFIIKWPSLDDAKKARKQTLMNFFLQNNPRYTDVNERRVEEIKMAFSLTDDIGVIEPNRIMIEVLIPQLKLLIEGILHFDNEIKQNFVLLFRTISSLMLGS